MRKEKAVGSSSSERDPVFCLCFLRAVRWFVGSEGVRTPLPARNVPGKKTVASPDVTPSPPPLPGLNRQITEEVRLSLGRRLSQMGTRTESTLVGITSLRLVKDPYRDIGQRYEILGEPLAHGGFSDVFKVRDRTTNEIRAAKRVPKNRISDNSLLERELELLLTLDHPNVVRLYDWFESPESIWLIQEMCTGGEVLNLVGNCGSRKALTVIRQILLGLAYLHDKGIIHRDVKLENCMFQSEDAESVVKIIDFGLAGLVRQPVSNSTTSTGARTGRAGTAIYLAPELKVSDNIEYSPKCDMWSLGISAFILLTGEHPFWDKRTSFVDSEMHARIQVKPADVSLIQPESAADFVSKLLRVDVKNRLSAHEALMHPCMRVSAFLGSELHLKLMSNLRSYKAFRPVQKVILTIMAYHAKDEVLREVFNLLDTDMNGVLSKQEIAKGMKKLGLILPSDFDEVVASIDADGSGEIDFTEFVAAGLSGDQILTQSLIDCAFGWLSGEQADVISLEDLEHVVSPEEARFTLEQYSTSGSGLSRTDFTKLVGDIAKIKKCNESPTCRAKRRSSWDNHTSPIHNPFRTLSDH